MKSTLSFQSLAPHAQYIQSTRPLTRLLRINKTSHQIQYQYQQQQRNMSFSNANTGNKPADPYKEKNIDETSIKEKVEDLTEFITASKFGMMTTREGKSGALVSRCMALAAKACRAPFSWLRSSANNHPGIRRNRPDIPHQYGICKPTKLMDPHTNVSFLQLVW